jgi:hypothetical protein
MRTYINVLAVGLLVAMTASAEVAAKNPVALVAVGPVDEALVLRLKEWAQNNLAVEVPLWKARPEAEATLEAAGDWAAGKLKPEDAGVVVLTWPSENLPTHGVLKMADRVFIANVRAMKNPGVDDEVFARRMERQVMRGIGLLVGLDLSPNPQSAMSEYVTLQDLDQIGRNYDPPWFQKFHARLHELGIPADTNSPYLMVP